MAPRIVTVDDDSLGSVEVAGDVRFKASLEPKLSRSYCNSSLLPHLITGNAQSESNLQNKNGRQIPVATLLSSK